MACPLPDRLVSTGHHPGGLVVAVAAFGRDATKRQRQLAHVLGQARSMELPRLAGIAPVLSVADTTTATTTSPTARPATLHEQPDGRSQVLGGHVSTCRLLSTGGGKKKEAKEDEAERQQYSNTNKYRGGG